MNDEERQRWDDASQNIVRLLFGSPAEDATTEPEQTDATPNFDGGVREPAPAPVDPYETHNAFMVGLIQQLPTNSGAGGEW